MALVAVFSCQRQFLSEAPPPTFVAAGMVSDLDAGFVHLDEFVHLRNCGPFPMMVVGHPETWWSLYLLEAIEWWNQRFPGAFVFMGLHELADHDVPGLVLNRWAKDQPADWIGRLEWSATRTGCLVHTIIVWQDVRDISHDLRLRAVIHELGHVLGLAHDPHIPWSIMYPAIEGSSSLYELTVGDQERLMSLYGKD